MDAQLHDWMYVNMLSVKQREQLLKSGSLHWVHWIVVGLSLLLTFTAWWFTKTQVDEKSKNQFERESQQIIKLVTERMQKYEDALRSGVGFIKGNNNVASLDKWKKFSSTLEIEKKYPGINGIGVIEYVRLADKNRYLAAKKSEYADFMIYPKHTKSILLPISFVEPFELNKKAVGLDMAHEKNRFTAAIKARDTGQPQITGPITLVQDSGQTPGFLFYFPYYNDTNINSLHERQTHFKGMVYAPFIVKNLMHGALASENRHVGLTIKDKSELLFDENNEINSRYDTNATFEKNISVPFYGRSWDFYLRSDLSFRTAAKNYQPLTILVGGIFIDTLLLMLFIFITRANKKAVDLVDLTTNELSKKANDLQVSNAELERFAYITSHDLRGPIRGMQSVVNWLKDELPNNISNKANEYIEKLENRLTRLDNLVTGILEYSKVDSPLIKKTQIDINTTIHDIFDLYLADNEKSIQIKAENLPSINGHKPHVEQVFSNLIGNAIKYNDKDLFWSSNTGHIH